MSDRISQPNATTTPSLVHSRKVAYVVSQELVKVSSLLPSNKNRSLLVHSLINSLGLLLPPGSDENLQTSRSNVIRPVRPRLATAQELCLYHDKDYVDFILDSKNAEESPQSQLTSSKFGIEDDCPPFLDMNKYVQMVAGATLSAADLLRSETYDISICWDGGRHHAQKSRAAGFCYVADCILAILSLKKSPPLPLFSPTRKKARIMYLDLDLHFSDAVSECFYKSASHNAASQVLTFSIHHSSPGFYPSSPLVGLPDPESPGFDPFMLSLPLEQGASSKTFGRVWIIVEAVKDVFCPDYVILQCGTDGLAGDPHGVWNWSIGQERGDMNWCVGEIINKWKSKVLLLGGGGYNSPNTARACAWFTSLAKGRLFPPDTLVPEHSAFPLYAPSFTLDVPAGNMRDENSDEYLCSVEETYSVVLRKLRERCM